jgi:hypothetical protein
MTNSELSSGTEGITPSDEVARRADETAELEALLPDNEAQKELKAVVDGLRDVCIEMSEQAKGLGGSEDFKRGLEETASSLSLLSDELSGDDEAGRVAIRSVIASLDQYTKEIGDIQQGLDKAASFIGQDSQEVPASLDMLVQSTDPKKVRDAERSMEELIGNYIRVLRSAENYMDDLDGYLRTATTRSLDGLPSQHPIWYRLEEIIESNIKSRLNANGQTRATTSTSISANISRCGSLLNEVTRLKA